MVTSQGRSCFDFEYDFGDYRTASRRVPESAVAYGEPFVRTLFPQHRLEIVEPIHFGRWSGRDRGITTQDVVLGVKRPSPRR